MAKDFLNCTIHVHVCTCRSTNLFVLRLLIRIYHHWATIGCLIIVFCMFILSAAYCDRWIFIETYSTLLYMYMCTRQNLIIIITTCWRDGFFPWGKHFSKRHRVSSLAPKCSPTVVHIHVECPADSDIAFVWGLDTFRVTSTCDIEKVFHMIVWGWKYTMYIITAYMYM